MNVSIDLDHHGHIKLVAEQARLCPDAIDWEVHCYHLEICGQVVEIDEKKMKQLIDDNTEDLIAEYIKGSQEHAGYRLACASGKLGFEAVKKELRQEVIRYARPAGFYKGLLEGLLMQCEAEGNLYTVSAPVFIKVKESFEKVQMEQEPQAQASQPLNALLACPFCGGRTEEARPSWNVANAFCTECGASWGHCGAKFEGKYEKFNQRAC